MEKNYETQSALAIGTIHNDLSDEYQQWHQQYLGVHLN